MKKIVVDTDILIDYTHNMAVWVPPLLKLSTYELVIPTIVIAEYFAATSLDEKDKAELADEILAPFIKHDLTEEIAREMGVIMRHKSHPPGAGTADLIIASTAIYLDAPIATRNKLHFKGIPSLRFFDPKEIEN